jgi:cell division protein ZapE
VPLTERYRRALAVHGYAPDPAQERAVARLEDLRRRLQLAERHERGILARLRTRFSGEPARTAVRGLYLWGGVGRGKTFLMDLFQASLGMPSRRSHFHRFMHDVHDRLRDLRELEIEDPLDRVAADLAQETRVLCFDELYVADIADAMLLSGLFGGLVQRGVSLVFTSNVPPQGLYRDGLQRARFLPAIDLLERCTEVLELDAGTDYRLRQLERAPLYVDLADPQANALLGARFEAIAGEPGAAGGTIEVEHRPIPVVRRGSNVAWFEFAALCEGPRSQADYIEIARQFHTVVVSGVPVFVGGRDDPARRFVALVDELYDRGVKLVVSAAAPANALYRGERLAFEFQRTASRLTEMQSHEYLARPHRPGRFRSRRAASGRVRSTRTARGNCPRRSLRCPSAR